MHPATFFWPRTQHSQHTQSQKRQPWGRPQLGAPFKPELTNGSHEIASRRHVYACFMHFYFYSALLRNAKSLSL